MKRAVFTLDIVIQVARHGQRNLRIEDELVPAVGEPVDERRHDGRPGLEGEHRQGAGGRGRVPEEGHEHAVPAGILVEQDADALPASQGRADALHRLALGDGTQPAPLARPRDQGFEVRDCRGAARRRSGRTPPARGSRRGAPSCRSGRSGRRCPRPWAIACPMCSVPRPRTRPSSPPAAPKKSRQHSTAVTPRCSKHWRARLARASGDRVSPYTRLRLSSATRRRPGTSQ